METPRAEDGRGKRARAYPTPNTVHQCLFCQTAFALDTNRAFKHTLLQNCNKGIVKAIR